MPKFLRIDDLHIIAVDEIKSAQVEDGGDMCIFFKSGGFVVVEQLGFEDLWNAIEAAT